MLSAPSPWSFAMMKSSRFRSPWRVIDIPGGFRVDDATGHSLGYFYFWDAPSKEQQKGVLTQDEALLMAETFSQVPDFLAKGGWTPDTPK
jgi:hypothetical protein